MPRVPGPGCRRCGEPRSWPVGTDPEWREEVGEAGADARRSLQTHCPSCDGWPETLRAAAAPFAFEGPAARLVKALKYGRWRKLARPMGDAMADSAKRLAEGSEPLLVPVPLSAARERERGFNQAELLARALASRTGWPWLQVLERRPGGRRQARLARHARSENVRELFGALHVGDTNSDILVVDDVLTTGATARACAETLHEAGFARVSVVTFARTLRPLEIMDDAA